MITTTKALRTALGSAIAVAALAAALTGCDGSGYASGEPTGDGSSISDTGFGSDPEFSSDPGFSSDLNSDPEFGFDTGSDSDFGSDTGSDSDSGSVIFGSDGDSLTTLPGGGISFSGSDGSSFSSE